MDDDAYEDGFEEPVAAPAPRRSRESKRTRAPRETRPSRDAYRPQTRERARQRTPSTRPDGGIEVTGKMGYARFQFMNFVTYGVDVAYEVVPNVAILGGIALVIRAR